MKRTPEGDEPVVLPPSTFDLVPMRFEMTPSTYHLYDGELLTVTTRVCSEGDRPARFTSMYPDFFEYSIVDSGQGFQFFTHVSGALDEDFEFVVPPGDCVEERYTWDRHQNFEPFAEAPPGYYHFWGGAHVRQEGDPGDAQPLGGAFWFQLHAGTRPADGGETAPFPADFDPPNKWTFHASVRGDRFVVGEPVHVDVQVCNQTDTAGRLLAVEGDDFPGHLQVEFRRDDGAEHFARLETMRYPAGQPTPAYEIPLPPRGCTSWVVTWNGTAGRFTDDMTGVDLVPPGNYRVGVSMFQPLPREQFAPQSHGFVTEIALVGA